MCADWKETAHSWLDLMMRRKSIELRMIGPCERVCVDEWMRNSRRDKKDGLSNEDQCPLYVEGLVRSLQRF